MTRTQLRRFIKETQQIEYFAKEMYLAQRELDRLYKNDIVSVTRELRKIVSK